MNGFFGRRRKVAVVAILALLACAGAAFAYWTTTGSGTGSGTTGSNVAVTVTQVGSITGLVPGGTAQAVDFKITNGQSTAQYVTSVSYTISSITKISDGTAATGCSSADFTLVQPTAIGQDLASGDTTFQPSGATLAMKDTSSNQDACKNTTVHLSFSAV